MPNEIKKWIADENEISTPAKRKAVAVTTFSVVDSNATDFVIKKVSGTRKTEEYLVIMPSKSVYYIKKKNGAIEAISQDTMKAFFRGHPDEIVLNGVNWIDKLTFYNGFCFINNLVDVMSGENFEKFVKFGKGIISIHAGAVSCFRDLDSVNFEHFLKVFEIAKEMGFDEHLIVSAASNSYISSRYTGQETPKELETAFLFTDNNCRKRYRSNNSDYQLDAFSLIDEKFGTGSAEYFIRTILSVPENPVHYYSSYPDTIVDAISDIVNFAKKHNIALDIKTFANYVTYSLHHQGYCIISGLVNWNGCLHTQQSLNNVFCFYPYNIEELTDDLSRAKGLSNKFEIADDVKLSDGSAAFKENDIVISLPKNEGELKYALTFLKNNSSYYIDDIFSGEKSMYIIRKKGTKNNAPIGSVVLGKDGFISSDGICNKPLPGEINKTVRNFLSYV